jgi:hypothetical protein
MVRAEISAVHLDAPEWRRHPDFPQGRSLKARQSRSDIDGEPQSVAITWAQIAIMPKNSASEARAAASSKMDRNIASSIGT